MRTVIDVDDEALAEAAAELGTTTKVATVNEALRMAAARRRTAAYLDLLAELDMDEDDRARAWRCGLTQQPCCSFSTSRRTSWPGAIRTRVARSRPWP
jgi:Arc/MetJ family transcription regulator